MRYTVAVYEDDFSVMLTMCLCTYLDLAQGLEKYFGKRIVDSERDKEQQRKYGVYGCRFDNHCRSIGVLRAIVISQYPSDSTSVDEQP